MGKEKFIFLNQIVSEAKWQPLQNSNQNSEAEIDKELRRYGEKDRHPFKTIRNRSRRTNLLIIIYIILEVIHQELLISIQHLPLFHRIMQGKLLYISDTFES